ncbi:hypothetical protein G7Z17_g2824 [Cylindrodendrum hubeiense]|uniref:Uncharacterized protein n=1 Tax=Cylindrodendrum hubeiense TaxID=595255 RepID=A0A9P5LKM1_9HYPO|nr:hypothetical protein G7Z17_g2824 [Cylindrodendrum hubeiense]
MKVFVNSGAPRGRMSLCSLYKIRLEKYYFGEYLSQGEVNVEGQCSEANFRDLRNSGLAVLYPWLFDWSLEGVWAKRVLHARVKYHISEKPIEDVEVQGAMGIAHLFEDRWRLPVTAMFISLIRRPRNAQVITHALRNAFRSGLIFFHLSNISIDDENLPEVESFRHVIEDLRRDFEQPEPEPEPTPTTTTVESLELALEGLALT